MVQRTVLVGLDIGLSYPSHDSLLVSRMGPQAFLDFLEVHAGLQPAKLSPSERIASFMAVMRRNESVFPSFLASWKVAPLATAKELLGWIDTWYLHGWEGGEAFTEGQDPPQRIAQISALEFLAREHLGASIGRRLLTVAAAIRSGIFIPLHHVELVDDIKDWPKAWQTVLSLLPCSQRTWKEFTLDDITSDRIQFFICHSTLTAARQLAEFSDKNKSASYFAIIEKEGTLFDEVNATSGRPEAGMRESAGVTPESQRLLQELAKYKEPGDLEFSRARALEVTKRVISKRGSFGTEWTGAIAEASLFVRTLERLGPDYDSLPWALLVELLSLCRSSDQPHPLHRELLGSLPAVRSAGALIEAVDSLVWFMPQPANRADPWPWTTHEIETLNVNGCELMDLETLNSRPLRMMLRACSLVQGSLTVIVPSIREELSPLELSIAARTAETRVEPCELEQAVMKGTITGLKEISARALPSVHRWWKLPLSLAPDPDWKTSFSQLSTFIDRPAQWLFEKKAGIQIGTLLSQQKESLRRGTCAHALVERLFAEKGDAALLLSKQEFKQWFEAVFPKTLEHCGYSYLEPGASREKIHYQNTLFESVLSLCQTLHDAGTSNIRLEYEVSGSFCHAELLGSIDLVFEKTDGSIGLIDMKYSFWPQGYIDKMVSDADMQLTLYSELYRQKNKILPEPAYWIFPSRKLITRNRSFFSTGHQVTSAHSHAQRLAMIEASVNWRKQELAQGNIEVVCQASDCLVKSGTALASVPPAAGLPKSETWDANDPYLGLYGWGIEA
ncbi:MAG: hypothetical protein HKM05_12425 [Spirochaetales bacterium]|nr:hypothetical protein [Spirochaetales bacterium]